MSKQKIGADNWLYILSHGLCNYVEEGGLLATRQTDSGLTITFTGVPGEDGRLHKKFRKLLEAQADTGSESESSGAK